MDIAALASELKNDPAGAGYKDASGNFKPMKELTRLLLYRPLVDNPDPQPSRMKPVSASEILGMLSQESLANIPYDALMAAREAADANDIERLSLQLQVFAGKGWITADETAAFQARLQETEPDPTWPAQVPGPCRLEVVTGERVLRSNDLANAVVAASVQ